MSGSEDGFNFDYRRRRVLDFLSRKDNKLTYPCEIVKELGSWPPEHVLCFFTVRRSQSWLNIQDTDHQDAYFKMVVSFNPFTIWVRLFLRMDS